MKSSLVIGIVMVALALGFPTKLQARDRKTQSILATPFSYPISSPTCLSPTTTDRLALSRVLEANIRPTMEADATLTADLILPSTADLCRQALIAAEAAVEDLTGEVDATERRLAIVEGQRDSAYELLENRPSYIPGWVWAVVGASAAVVAVHLF